MSIEGSSDIPIFLSGLDCVSTIHNNVLDCVSSPHGRPERECSHELDVYVRCEGMKPNKFSVQTVNVK